MGKRAWRAYRMHCKADGSMGACVCICMYVYTSSGKSTLLTVNAGKTASHIHSTRFSHTYRLAYAGRTGQAGQAVVKSHHGGEEAAHVEQGDVPLLEAVEGVQCVRVGALGWRGWKVVNVHVWVSVGGWGAIPADTQEYYAGGRLVGRSAA